MSGGGAIIDADKFHKCPTCGSVWGTQKSMRLHHVQAHGESLGGEDVDYTCDLCGEVFTASQYAIDRNKTGVYCSEMCQRYSGIVG